MSQSAINEAIRVLSGKKLKFTAVVNKPDGSKIEFQTDREPEIKWHDDLRCVYLYLSPEQYIRFPSMKWEDDYILTCEKNPE